MRAASVVIAILVLLVPAFASAGSLGGASSLSLEPGQAAGAGLEEDSELLPQRGRDCVAMSRSLSVSVSLASCYRLLP